MRKKWLLHSCCDQSWSVSAFVNSAKDDQLSFFFLQKMSLSDSQNSVQTYTSAPCYVLTASSSPRMDATCANANLVITIIDNCWYYMYCYSVSLSCTLIVFSVKFSIAMVCHLLYSKCSLCLKRVQQIWNNKTDTTDQKNKLW